MKKLAEKKGKSNFYAKEQWRYILVLLVALAFRSLCYMRFMKSKLRTDDFGPLNYAAYLGGKNWKTLVSNMETYYGYGYYWIFAPLFKFMHSSTAIWVTIVMINSLLIVLSAGLVYHIVLKYFKLKPGIFAMLLAVIPSLIVGDVPITNGNNWYRMDNEMPLYFAIWLLVWCLLKGHELGEKKAKYIYRFINGAACGLLLAWSLSVHERALAMLMAVMISEVLVLILKRRFVIEPVGLFGFTIVGYKIQRAIRKIVIATFWGSADALRNTDAFNENGWWFTEGLLNFKAFAVVFFGNLHSYIIKSYGLPCAALALIVMWIAHNWISFKKNPKKVFDADGYEQKPISPEIFIMMIFGATVLIVITGIAQRWGEGFLVGLETDKVVYEYKGICYSRYYYNFISPLVVAMLAYAPNHIKTLRKIAWPSYMIFLVIEGIFAVLVLPYASRQGEMKYIRRASNLQLMYENNLIISVIIMGICVLILPMALEHWTNPMEWIREIFPWFFKKKKAAVKEDAVKDGGILKMPTLFKSGAVGVAVMVLAVTFTNRIEDITPSNVGFVMKDTAGFEEVIEAFDAQGIELPDIIYLDMKDNVKYNLQFLFMDQTFTFGEPEDISAANIVITKKTKPSLMSYGYKYVLVEDEYYFYTNIDVELNQID